MTDRFFSAVWAAILAFSLASCATSTPGDVACDVDSDCPAGEVCDPGEQQCIRASIVTNNGTPTNNGDPDRDMGDPNNGTPNNGQLDMGMPDEGNGGDDAGPRPCVPACADNEVCDDGQCVSACEPACAAPQICTATGCEFPDCVAVGDECDPARPDQGAFACLSGEDSGICVEKCAEAFTASTCATGEYCWTVQNQDVCVPSTCSDHGDCTNGSCIDFDNSFSICFAAGAIPMGSACDPNDNQCEPGTFCRDTGPTTGVCSKICDQWAAQPGCPVGELCAFQFTFRSALCTSDVDPTGDTAFYVCDDIGAACDDATVCFDVGADNACLKYCRPGLNDCMGVTDGLGTPTVCHSYAFGGVREVGLCFSSCSSTADCGAGSVCLQNMCRTTCRAGMEVADCCGGAQPCRFTCNQDLLCE